MAYWKTDSCRDGEIRRHALMEDCKIAVLGKGKINLSLPAQLSRLEFLQIVQAVARSVYGRHAVYTAVLEKWATEREFIQRPSSNVAIAVNGRVAGSTRKSRDEQVSFLKTRGLVMPALCDLAVAHSAYFLATGTDLFCGNLVRARGGALKFFSNGLHFYCYCHDDFRVDTIAASALLLVWDLNSA